VQHYGAIFGIIVQLKDQKACWKLTFKHYFLLAVSAKLRLVADMRLTSSEPQTLLPRTSLAQRNMNSVDTSIFCLIAVVRSYQNPIAIYSQQPLLYRQRHQVQHHNEINIRAVSPNESLRAYRIGIIRSTVHLSMRDIRSKRHQLPRGHLIQENIPVSTVWLEVKASEKLTRTIYGCLTSPWT
jgi:hypothetical protein